MSSLLYNIDFLYNNITFSLIVPVGFFAILGVIFLVANMYFTAFIFIVIAFIYGLLYALKPMYLIVIHEQPNNEGKRKRIYGNKLNKKINIGNTTIGSIGIYSKYKDKSILNVTVSDESGKNDPVDLNINDFMNNMYKSFVNKQDWFNDPNIKKSILVFKEKLNVEPFNLNYI